jgi:hypothetical protein
VEKSSIPLNPLIKLKYLDLQPLFLSVNGDGEGSCGL